MNTYSKSHHVVYLCTSQLEVFRHQNSELLQEYAALSQQLGEAQEEAAQLEHHMNRLLGESIALESVATIEECEELERSLKTALDRIEAKKVGEKEGERRGVRKGGSARK